MYGAASAAAASGVPLLPPRSRRHTVHQRDGLDAARCRCRRRRRRRRRVLMPQRRRRRRRPGQPRYPMPLLLMLLLMMMVVVVVMRLVMLRPALRDHVAAAARAAAGVVRVGRVSGACGGDAVRDRIRHA